jgi:hypothetical protein
MQAQVDGGEAVIGDKILGRSLWEFIGGLPAR